MMGKTQTIKQTVKGHKINDENTIKKTRIDLIYRKYLKRITVNIKKNQKQPLDYRFPGLGQAHKVCGCVKHKS